MKQALIIVIAVVGLLAWGVLMFRNEEAVSISAAPPWPGEMATLKAAEARWPTLKANDASVQLATLARALTKNEEVDKFVEREITRGDLAIGDPPAIPEVSQIRELLVREPVIWESRVEFDDVQVGERRTMQMTVARALVASALTKARAKDPTAWEDLHAAWKLANSLNGHPQMMAQTAALTMARMINAVARRMPTPVPAWFGELQERDNVRPLLEAYQYQVASYGESRSQWFPTKWLAASVDHDRKIAEELFNLTRCDVTTPMNDLGTDLSSVWRRAFRYRAEREATANALRVREGKSIETSSQCSDGGWTFDGTTLRFSREIATAAPDSPMPLVLRLKP
jgi:hypothetical protein